MRRILLSVILSLVFFAVEAQNTVALKTIETYYGNMIQGPQYNRIGVLNEATINADSIGLFIPEIAVKNIGNDTIQSGSQFQYTIYFLLYSDTGLLLPPDENESYTYTLYSTLYPNDTFTLAATGYMSFPLADIIKYDFGTKVPFEQIDHWMIIGGISYTSDEGFYADSSFYAMADTSIFYVVKGDVSIKEMGNGICRLVIAPNPAQSVIKIQGETGHFSNIDIYDITGRKVKTAKLSSDNSADISELPSGIYYLIIRENNNYQIGKFIKE